MKTVAWVLGSYSLICLIFYLAQSRLLFFPQPVSNDNLKRFKHFETKFLVGSRNIQAWFVPAEISVDKPVLIYFGGNGEEVSNNLFALNYYPDMAMLFVNYAGYGSSQGTPSEQVFYRDAMAIVDTFAEQQGITSEEMILVGRSLGSAVATYVAQQRKVKQLVLITPPSSLADVGQHHYPLLPIKWLLRHRFDSLQRAPTIETPMTAIIAAEDKIIPPVFSEKLVAAWGGPVNTLRINGAGHNDIAAYEDYWKALKQTLMPPLDN